jgi:hypothetical protein
VLYYFSRHIEVNQLECKNAAVKIEMKFHTIKVVLNNHYPFFQDFLFFSLEKSNYQKSCFLFPIYKVFDVIVEEGDRRQHRSGILT